MQWEDGLTQQLIVPKGFKKVELTRDSAQLPSMVFHYKNGAELYFTRSQDTVKPFEFLPYDEQEPKELYGATYYKSADGNGTLYRTERFRHYTLGYRKVPADDEWRYDSTLNYFVLRVAAP